MNRIVRVLPLLAAAVGCSGAPRTSVRTTQGQVVVNTVEVGGAPLGITIGFGGALFVDNARDLLRGVGRLGDTYQVQSVTPVGRSPEQVAVLGNAIYVTNNSDDEVSVFLPNASPPRLDRFDTGHAPTGITAFTGGIFVANSGDGTVTSYGAVPPYDGPTTLELGPGSVPMRFAIDDNPRNPGFPRLFVTNGLAGTVWQVSPVAMESAVLPSGSAPIAIAVNPFTRRIYVALYNADQVAVLNADDPAGAPPKLIAVGPRPSALAVNPATNSILVTSETDGTVTVIDGATDTPSTVIRVGRRPMGIAVDSGTFEVFVTNFGDGTISVFQDPASTQQVFTVPVRLCGVRHPEVRPPAKQDLVALLQNASDGVWLRSGARVVFQAVGFDELPLIDLVSPDVGSRGGDQASRLCIDAWRPVSGALGIPVIVGRCPEGFLGATGCSNFSAGFAPAPNDLIVNPDGSPKLRTPALCQVPRQIGAGDVYPEWVILRDPKLFTREVGAPGRALAHELGHALLLGHGNGLDDNSDGVAPPLPGYRSYDVYCDRLGYLDLNTPHEDPTGSFPICPRGDSLMRQFGTCDLLQPLQIEQAHDVAPSAPGVLGSADPIGEISDGPPCAAQPCAIAEQIQLLVSAIADTPGPGATSFTHSVDGVMTTSMHTDYWTIVDADNDSATGCDPAALGIASSFAGVEMVGRVEVTGSGSTPLVSASFWRCVQGAFSAAVPPELSAAAFSQTSAETGAPVGGLVKLTMPDATRGPMGTLVRFEAIARDLTAGGVNRLPRAGGGRVVNLIPPDLPRCSVGRPVMRPGEANTVSVSSLPPSRPVLATLFDTRLGSGNTDASVSAQIAFTLAANATPGLRLVNVNVENSGRSASCVVHVAAGATTPATVAVLSPTPNASGWNRSDTTIALSASPAVTGAPIQNLTFSATGAQIIPVTVVNGAAASFVITHEGSSTIQFHALDEAGVSEADEALVVRVDKSPPVVAATGSPAPNAQGWNRTPVRVSFVCTDAISEVVHCSPPVLISSEGIGVAVQGSAADIAGNTGTGNTSLNIDLTLPLLAYGNARPAYTVDESVDITCTTSDALSGILSTTCQPIAGPAYQFAIGQNMFSARSIDRADNETVTSIAFEVRVTFASLCKLSRRFSNQNAVDIALCSTLGTAETFALAGLTGGKNAALGAYRVQVQAQSGRAMSPGDALVLLRLVNYL